VVFALCRGSESAAEISDDISEATGLGLAPMIALFEDTNGDPPPSEGGQEYAEAYDISGFPVTSDVDQSTIATLPDDGTALPAQCVLNPDMVILGCHLGRDAAAVIIEWLQTDAAR
jgi:hypothetical protein